MERQTSTLRAEICLVPYINTAYDRWNYLQNYENQMFSSLGVKLFENTYDKKYSKYNGQVIGRIYVTTSNWLMDKGGYTVTLISEMYNGYSNAGEYKFTYTDKRN